jgi:hypothetical protein
MVSKQTVPQKVNSHQEVISNGTACQAVAACLQAQQSLTIDAATHPTS